MSVVCHAAAPAAGLVDTTAFPFSSTATHRDAAGQDSAARRCGSLIFALLQAPAPPVGSVVVNTYPALSTAAQKYAEGQEIAVNLAEHVFVSSHSSVLLST
jgi:hypothetical protein